MPVVRGQFAENLAPGLNMRTFNKYRERPEIYRQIVTVKDSNRAYEEDFALSGFGPLVPKGELERTTLDEPFKLGGVRFIHKTYALGFEISQEMREDDQYSLINDLSAELGLSSRRTAELYGHDVYNNGFTNTKYAGRDGLALFSLVHPVPGTGGTQANKPAVDTDLSQAALEAGWGAFQSYTDERGLPIDIQPRVLLVHPSQILFARRLLESSGYTGSNINDINPLYNIVTIASSPYLTDLDAWYLLAAPGEVDVRFYWRRKPDTRTWDDDDAEATIHKISQRHSVGFADWIGTYASPGA